MVLDLVTIAALTGALCGLLIPYGLIRALT